MDLAAPADRARQGGVPRRRDGPARLRRERSHAARLRPVDPGGRRHRRHPLPRRRRRRRGGSRVGRAAGVDASLHAARTSSAASCRCRCLTRGSCGTRCSATGGNVEPAKYVLGYQLPLLPERRLTEGNAWRVGDLLHEWSGPADWPPRDVEAMFRSAMLTPATAHCALEYHRWAIRSIPRRDGRRFVEQVSVPVDVPVLHVHGVDDPSILLSSAEGSREHVAGPYAWRPMRRLRSLPARGAGRQVHRDALEWLAADPPWEDPRPTVTATAAVSAPRERQAARPAGAAADARRRRSGPGGAARDPWTPPTALPRPRGLPARRAAVPRARGARAALAVRPGDERPVWRALAQWAAGLTHAARGNMPAPARCSRGRLTASPERRPRRAGRDPTAARLDVAAIVRPDPDVARTDAWRGCPGAGAGGATRGQRVWQGPVSTGRVAVRPVAAASATWSAVSA